jgi:ethanolamine ammonia-lyase large subunit
MGIPGGDDIMLAYQTTSFHVALYLRRVLGLRPAPEFEDWLNRRGIFDGRNALSRNFESPWLLGDIKELTGEET